MSLSVTPRSATTAAAPKKDPQAAFQEKLAGYITRHLHEGTTSELPSALRKLATTKGVSFDSSGLLDSKGTINGVKQPPIAIIDMNTGPNPELVLHHPRRPNDGYVLLAAAVGTQHPLTLNTAIDISTPALASLKTTLKTDPKFLSALAAAGQSFSDVKFVVGDAIGKKDGGDFAGEFTDSGAGRYGVYVPGTKGKPVFAQNYIVQSDVTLVKGSSGKMHLHAEIGAPTLEQL